MIRRSSSSAVSLVVAIISLFVWYGQQHNWFASAAKSAGGSTVTNTVSNAAGQVKKGIEQNQPGQYRVVRPVDGDTIVVDMSGTPETVRFIGVDTPETHKPNTPVQCYGPAAAAFTRNTLKAAGNSVRLAADSLSSNRDRYKRLLRYVYLPDGTLLNLKLISEGYGFYYLYFPFSKSADFSKAQDEAKAAKKGLWGNCNPIAKDKGGYESNPQ